MSRSDGPDRSQDTPKVAKETSSKPLGLDGSLGSAPVAPRNSDEFKGVLPPPAPKITLKSFYNTKPEFGDGGPFEAPTREALADEMLPTFTLWAEEKWEKDEEADHDFKPEYIAQTIGQMQQKFIAGLEERDLTLPHPALAMDTIELPDYNESTAFPCTIQVHRKLADGTVIGLAAPTAESQEQDFGPVPVVVYPDGEIMCSTNWQRTPDVSALDDLDDANQRGELRWMRARDGRSCIILNDLPRILE